MKTLFNMTTDHYDLTRYQNEGEFRQFMTGFDGIELMCFDADTENIIAQDMVVGLHTKMVNYWIDLWRGNHEELLREHGTAEQSEKYYGVATKEHLINSFKDELSNAVRYGAEYMVLHVSNSAIVESITRRFRHTDAEIIDAFCDIINSAFAGVKDGPTLLFENLWYPGLTFTAPDMTRRLMDKIEYENKGIMLDTGHIMHMNMELKSQEEAVSYIHKMLDIHGDLTQYVRGVHLNKSLTGAFAKEVMENPPVLAEDYAERVSQLYEYIFKIEEHHPFTCKGVKGLVERINPEYLVFEFVTMDSEQHRGFLKEQLAALEGLWR